MTLIVGFNFGSYALIGADARVSYYPDGQLQFRDDNEKIRETSLGLITGAGFANLLDLVKVRLLRQTASNTDEIISIIKEERERLKQAPWWGEKRIQEALQTTAWMFTYYGTGQSSADNPTEMHLRLAITVPQEGYKLALVTPGQSWLLAPTGTTDQQFSEWREFLVESQKPLNRGEPALEHLAHHSKVVAELMRRVAAVNDGVCETFQLGVHLFGGGLGLSSLIGPDGEYTWRWID